MCLSTMLLRARSLVSFPSARLAPSVIYFSAIVFQSRKASVGPCLFVVSDCDSLARDRNPICIDTMPRSITAQSNRLRDCEFLISMSDLSTSYPLDFRGSGELGPSEPRDALSGNKAKRDPYEEPLYSVHANFWAPHSSSCGGPSGAYPDTYGSAENSSWAHGRSCYTLPSVPSEYGG